MEIDRKWKRVIKDINAITPEYMKHRIEEETQQYKQEIERLNNIIKDIEDYINFLVIYNQTISGKFSETQWGQDILGLIGSDKEWI